MATIFTRIINGELPGQFVWRNPQAVAFLSINPINRGHTLVVPVAEVDHWLDLPPQDVDHLFEVSRVIGQAQMKAFRPMRIALIVAGFEVPHCHVHVIPASGMRHVSFDNASTSVPGDELAASADMLRSTLREMGRTEASA